MASPVEIVRALHTALEAGQHSDDIEALLADDVTVREYPTWSGTVREPAGPFAAGQQLTAHIAQFVTVRDDRISAIATYDCYEPFGA